MTRLAAGGLLLLLTLVLGVKAAEEETVDFLSTKLRDSSSFKVRLKAAVLLGRLRDPAAGEPLVKALRDESYVVRGAAARALGNLGLPAASGAIDGLFQLLDDEVIFVQQEAIRALTRLASPESLGRFIEALAAVEPARRLFAVQVLAALKFPEARGALMLALGDEEAEVEETAIEALRCMPAPDLEAELRIALTRKERYRVQAGAARLAGDLRLTGLIEPLADLLVSDDVVPEVKRDAAQAIAAMKGALDVAKLRGQLGSDDRALQARAVQLLGLQGGPEAVDALVQLLQSPDAFVRRRAVFALGDAGDPRAVPALESLLKTEQDERTKVIIERDLRKLK